jgi:hypothetical protein
MTPESNGRGHDAPRSPDPDPFIREIVANLRFPEDSGETEDRPPWPEDADGPRFTFPELIEREALGYRAWGNSVGDFLARQLEQLAQLVRWTQAPGPDEFEARLEAWDAEVRASWEARGFEAGKRSGDQLP